MRCEVALRRDDELELITVAGLDVRPARPAFGALNAIVIAPIRRSGSGPCLISMSSSLPTARPRPRPGGPAPVTRRRRRFGLPAAAASALEARLRVDQELAGGHDPLAGREALADLASSPPDSGPSLDVDRREPVAASPAATTTTLRLPVRITASGGTSNTGARAPAPRVTVDEHAGLQHAARIARARCARAACASRRSPPAGSRSPCP